MSPPPPAIPAPADKPRLPSPHRSTPAFSSATTTVIFALGGPGAGKGTQCANLVRDFHFTHLSAGDLLRAEQSRPQSQFGSLISQYIREGQIVPTAITVALLENAMREAMAQDKHKFLIDGFPRKMDQAQYFEENVCESVFTLFFDTKEEVMQKRLLKRGETSGREDDNADSIRKRFRTFVDTSMPVVKAMEAKGKVVRVDASPGPDEVYGVVKQRVAERLEAKA